MSNHPFRPLRHRAVRLIWGASVVSDIGTWVQLVIIGSLVARESGSALQTGAVALATFLPQGISSPVGGLLADRYDRRRIFMIGLTGQGIATSILATALALGVRNPGTIVLIILCGSSMGALCAPAYSAMVPDLVPPEELMPMVSLGILSWNSGRVIGPIVGTVLAATAGPAWSIGFNAITFLGLASAVYLVHLPFPPDPNADRGTVAQRLAVGWRAMRSTPGCWHGWYVVVLMNIAIAPFMGLIPIYARTAFHGGTGLTGLFSTTQGVGAILGTFIVAAIAARFGPARALGILAPTAVIVYLAWALAPNTGTAIAVVACMGFCSSGIFVTGMSTVQRDAPSEQRGRVMSIAQASMGCGYGAGLVLVGAIGDAVNLRVGFLVAAAIFASGFAYLTHRSAHWREAIDGVEYQSSDRGTLAVA